MRRSPGSGDKQAVDKENQIPQVCKLLCYVTHGLQCTLEGRGSEIVASSNLQRAGHRGRECLREYASVNITSRVPPEVKPGPPKFCFISLRHIWQKQTAYTCGLGYEYIHSDSDELQYKVLPGISSRFLSLRNEVSPECVCYVAMSVRTSTSSPIIATSQWKLF